MNRQALTALLDQDVDDIGRAALRLAPTERWPALEAAAAMLDGQQAPLRIVKILVFLQAALSAAEDATLPYEWARVISKAATETARGADVSDVHRAANDVLELLSIKSRDVAVLTE